MGLDEKEGSLDGGKWQGGFNGDEQENGLDGEEQQEDMMVMSKQMVLTERRGRVFLTVMSKIMVLTERSGRVAINIVLMSWSTLIGLAVMSSTVPNPS